MQSNKRYVLLFLSIFFGFAFIFWLSESVYFCSTAKPRTMDNFDIFPSFATYTTLFDRNERLFRPKNASQCNMGVCFDRLKCRSHPYKVFIYPKNNANDVMSDAYEQMLTSIRESRYFTDNPDQACLFVLTLNTLDRDRISGNYVPNLNTLILNLPRALWNGGRNHLIFNMYHGTYPDYRDDDFGFDPGLAMLARASTSIRNFRPEYDISFPLFHNKDLELQSPEPAIRHPSSDGHLLSFKGKRYVYGIGSETRDSLRHLHNGRSVVAITTCRHNDDWTKHQDQWCQEDNREYELWDYSSLMRNSSFCLVPRGRRLGSFRFLESLRSGCIPVILSDDWILPFSSIIPWSDAVIHAPQKSLLLLPEILRSVDANRILKMKQRGRQIFRQYFASVQKIVDTTLEIIFARLDGFRHGFNAIPMSNLVTFPQIPQLSEKAQFSAVIFGADSTNINKLRKLMIVLMNLSLCRNIIILWSGGTSTPTLSNISSKNRRVHFFHIKFENRSEIFAPRHEFKTAAIFLIDVRVSLNADELKFALSTWRSFPSRFIGFFARSTVFRNGHWHYSSQLLNHYSIVLPDAAILHRDLLSHYQNWLSPSLAFLTAEQPYCHDILFNVFHTEYTGRPPIAISNRQYPSSLRDSGQKSACFERLYTQFWRRNRPPLLESRVKFDPALFLDKVANFRKFYPQMEIITRHD